jgi:hypothetical protein
VFPEQFPQQFQGCTSVPALLDQDIQNFAFLIDSTPHEHAPPDYTGYHYIEMPDRTRARARSPNVGRNGPAEFLGPAADRLVRDVDPALGESLLHIPQTEGELEIQPNGLADDLRGKPVSFVGDCSHLAPLSETSCH